jgi:hypothetical protein
MTELNRETMAALLDEIKELAADASLMGTLKHGIRPLVDVYNRCVTTMAKHGDEMVSELFPTLDPAATNMDEVGAYAALLMRYLRPRNPRRDDDDDDEELEDEDDD